MKNVENLPKTTQNDFVYSHYYTNIMQISLLSRCRSLHISLLIASF